MVVTGIGWENLEWEVAHDFWIVGYCLDGASGLGWYNLGLGC